MQEHLRILAILHQQKNVCFLIFLFDQPDVLVNGRSVFVLLSCD